MGGLFTTYVLFNAPESFQRIFIGSPALWWDDEAKRDWNYREKNGKMLANPMWPRPVTLKKAAECLGVPVWAMREAE